MAHQRHFVVAVLRVAELQVVRNQLVVPVVRTLAAGLEHILAADPVAAAVASAKTPEATASAEQAAELSGSEAQEWDLTQTELRLVVAHQVATVSQLVPAEQSPVQPSRLQALRQALLLVLKPVLKLLVPKVRLLQSRRTQLVQSLQQEPPV